MASSPFRPSTALGQLILCTLLWTCPAWAAKPEWERLGRDEGLLVLPIDSDSPYESLRFERLDSVLPGPVMEGGDKVRTLRFLPMAAGRYRLQKLNIPTSSFYLNAYVSFDDQPEFEIRAGEALYVGDLIVRSRQGGDRWRARLGNSLARLNYQLRHEYPELLAKLPLRYSRAELDPLAEVMSSVGESAWPLPSAANVQVTSWPLAKSSKPAPSALELTTPGLVQDIGLSPDGAHLFMELRDDKTYRVLLVNPALGDGQELIKAGFGFGNIYWISEQRLVVGIPSWGEEKFALFEWDPPAEGETAKPRRRNLPIKGYVVDRLIDDPEHILVAHNNGKGEDSQSLFKLNIAGDTIPASQLRSRYRLDKGIENEWGWTTDRHGDPAYAFIKEKELVYLIRWKANGYDRIRTVSVEHTFTVIGVADGPNNLFALSNENREQVELVRLNKESGEIIETVLAIPGVDLVSATVDPRTRHPIEVRGYLNGEQKSWNVAGEVLNDNLKRRFGELSATLVSQTEDHQRILILAGKTDHPLSYYWWDRTTDALKKLVDWNPQLSQYEYSSSESFTVTSKDDLKIESYLTPPVGVSSDWPLVVMPHGGPHGIRDTRGFDRDVQYLATHGIGVLLVNFRGSGGFGTEFRDAVKDDYSGIQEDIYRATNEALKRHPIDPTRVALAGQSHGGYATMMALIEKPDLYRCGVSTAGVSDLSLGFTNADYSEDKEAIATKKILVGDPATELPKLMNLSPLYRSDELNNPILLIHGAKDERVPFEHSFRMWWKLALKNPDTPVLVLPKLDHSYGTVTEAALIMETTLRFLTRCLELPVAEVAETAEPTKASDHQDES